MEFSEDWTICWEVNAAFVVIPDVRNSLGCYACQRELNPMNRYSSITLNAIQSQYWHQSIKYLCAKCDVDFLLRVTRGLEKCHVCSDILRIDLEAVEYQLSQVKRKPDLLNK